jgi:hypothetical protein
LISEKTQDFSFTTASILELEPTPASYAMSTMGSKHSCACIRIYVFYFQYWKLLKEVSILA